MRLATASLARARKELAELLLGSYAIVSICADGGVIVIATIILHNAHCRQLKL